MKKTKKLAKPKKHNKEFYDFHEVRDYLQELHGKDFRDYAGHWNDDKQPYQDFWHALVDYCDVRNDSFFNLPDIATVKEDWVREILGYFDEFLGDDYYENMWVSW